jgi:hypothetical protein
MADTRKSVEEREIEKILANIFSQFSGGEGIDADQ